MLTLDKMGAGGISQGPHIGGRVVFLDTERRPIIGLRSRTFEKMSATTTLCSPRSVQAAAIAG